MCYISRFVVYNKGPTSAPCCSFLTDRLNLLRLFMISKKQIRSRKGRDPSRRDGLSGEPEAGWAVQDFISTRQGQPQKDKKVSKIGLWYMSDKRTSCSFNMMIGLLRCNLITQEYCERPSINILIHFYKQ